MSSPGNSFDAVEMMRAIRERLSSEIEGMSFEEEVRWLASQPLSDPLLKRLQERAAQQPLASDGERKRA